MSSSVYFHLQLPAHVLVLLKRLVNVVSTLSISNECVNANSRARAGEVEAQIQIHDVPVNGNGNVKGLIGVKQHGSTKTTTTTKASAAAAAPSLKAITLPKDFDSLVALLALQVQSRSPTSSSSSTATSTPDLLKAMERRDSWPLWTRNWQWNRGLLIGVGPPASVKCMSTHADAGAGVGAGAVLGEMEGSGPGSGSGHDGERERELDRSLLSATTKDAAARLSASSASSQPPSEKILPKSTSTRWTRTWTLSNLFSPSFSSSSSAEPPSHPDLRRLDAHTRRHTQTHTHAHEQSIQPHSRIPTSAYTSLPESSPASAPEQAQTLPTPPLPPSSSSTSYPASSSPSSSPSPSPSPTPSSSSSHPPPDETHSHSSTPDKNNDHNNTYAGESEYNHTPKHNHDTSKTNHITKHNHDKPNTNTNPNSNPHLNPNTSNTNATDLPPDIIHQLLIHPALFDPVRTPRYPIVLCHGLYGFDSRGPSSFPSMRMHYWANVLNILRGTVGAEVIVTSVPGTGFISTRASALHTQLTHQARGRGINFLAHSMGGLDSRYLVSRIQPREYVPLSVTSVGTPHRGSAFMDWCANNIGLGKLRQQEQEREREGRRFRGRDEHEEDEDETELEMMRSLGNRTRKNIEEFTADIGSEASSSASARRRPSSSSSTTSSSSTSSPLSLSSLSSLPSSFTTLLLSVVDSPAYANLTSSYLNDAFNPSTPDDPRVKYWSVAGRMGGGGVGVWHPFWLPKMVLDGVEERERERLRAAWVKERETRGLGGDFGEGWDERAVAGGKIPLWADERQWGNDGLVTVQSAQWGEFLGIMEGCDHWEMRGARGIELGVDLPAIPAIGLGSFPLQSSLGNRRAGSAQAQGDGWGFGDWTRFVGAWKSSGGEAKEKETTTTTASDANTVVVKSESETKALVHLHPKSPPPPTPTPKTTPIPIATESNSQKRERERLADDHVVKSSTDTLSVVFDWLIERVPVSTHILGGGGSSGSSSSTPKKGEKGRTMSDKELSDVAVRHMVGGSASSTASASSSSSSWSDSAPQKQQSDMKKRMDREDKTRDKKRELARKEDLERFYVALTRKMYDEGL